MGQGVQPIRKEQIGSENLLFLPLVGTIDCLGLFLPVGDANSAGRTNTKLLTKPEMFLQGFETRSLTSIQKVAKDSIHDDAFCIFVRLCAIPIHKKGNVSMNLSSDKAERKTGQSKQRRAQRTAILAVDWIVWSSNGLSAYVRDLSAKSPGNTTRIFRAVTALSTWKDFLNRHTRFSAHISWCLKP